MTKPAPVPTRGGQANHESGTGDSGFLVLTADLAGRIIECVLFLAKRAGTNLILRGRRDSSIVVLIFNVGRLPAEFCVRCIIYAMYECVTFPADGRVDRITTSVQKLGYSRVFLDIPIPYRDPMSATILTRALTARGESSYLLRATVTILDETDFVYWKELLQILQRFDLIAINPKSQWALDHCLLSNSGFKNFHLISIDLSEKCEFYLSHMLAYHTKQKEIFWEISFSGSFHDPVRKKNFISNSRNLIRVLRNGDRVILWSRADTVRDLRSRVDVMALGHLIGIGLGSLNFAMNVNLSRILK